MSTPKDGHQKKKRELVKERISMIRVNGFALRSSNSQGCGEIGDAKTNMNQCFMAAEYWTPLKTEAFS
jgi:hypothetical protein